MIAPAKFIGWQEGVGAIADFPVFNLTAPIDGHPAGSTVSGRALEEAGYELPPIIEVRRHPRGGFTRAVPVGGTSRIYCGWWPSRSAALAAFFNSPSSMPSEAPQR